MSRWGTLIALSQTSWQECALLGHREIDVEHVLLATMEDEGVARMLVRHGVTREGTRQQVDAVVREQLGTLGVELGDVPLTQRRSITDLHHDAVGDLELSDRAQQLVAGSTSVPGVLLAALDAPDGTAVRLLQRQGADVGAVRTDLQTLLADTEGGGFSRQAVDLAALPDTGLVQGRPGVARHRSRFYAVPWERVWGQVSTADAVRSWMLAGEQTRVSGPGELTGHVRKSDRPEGRLRGTFVRRLLAMEPPTDKTAGHVLWQDQWESVGKPWRSSRSGPGQWFHVTVTPVAGGTQVAFVLGSVVWGRSQRLLRPVLRIGQLLASRNALYQLGMVLEEDAGEHDRQ